MHAKINWIDNVHFEASADSGHVVHIDGAPEAGGQNLGARPMELMLMGVGGCASFDVVTILRKSRQKVVACTADVTATRVDTIPQVFDEVHLQFTVTGDSLDPRSVERAVRLSVEKYCSAARMLEQGGVRLSHGFDVRDAAGPAEA